MYNHSTHVLQPNSIMPTAQNSCSTQPTRFDSLTAHTALCGMHSQTSTHHERNRQLCTLSPVLAHKKLNIQASQMQSCRLKQLVYMKIIRLDNSSLVGMVGVVGSCGWPAIQPVANQPTTDSQSYETVRWTDEPHMRLRSFPPVLALQRYKAVT